MKKFQNSMAVYLVNRGILSLLFIALVFRQVSLEQITEDSNPEPEPSNKHNGTYCTEDILSFHLYIYILFGYGFIS